jgi:hypothetical protein
MTTTTKNSLLPSAEDTTLLEIVQQQSVIINQLVLSNQNMEMQLEKQSGELAAVWETVENQSTSMVTALATSLIGALQGVWHGDGERVGSRESAEPGAWTPSSMTTSNQQNLPEPPLSPLNKWSTLLKMTQWHLSLRAFKGSFEMPKTRARKANLSSCLGLSSMAAVSKA